MEATWQPSFFDDYDRQQRAERLGDPLQRLQQRIDFEFFRPVLEEALAGTEPRGPGGRPRMDVVMMFKVLILQRLHQLSDEQTEYQINDRQSFSRFLGLRGAARIPDYTTIWRFREALIQRDLIKTLFALFTEKLQQEGLVANEGIIVDASFVEVPRQRNTREENALIKQGTVPPAWLEQPHKLAHKDCDARWAQKNQETHFGYKNHVKMDHPSGYLLSYEVTSAEVHDSQELKGLITPEDRGKMCFGDSAFRSAQIEEWLASLEIKSFIHEKGVRGRDLALYQKLFNTLKSRVRATVEHVFGLMENTFGLVRQHVIGLKRNAAQIGLMNLTYNLWRYARSAQA